MMPGALGAGSESEGNPAHSSSRPACIRYALSWPEHTGFGSCSGGAGRKQNGRRGMAGRPFFRCEGGAGDQNEVQSSAPADAVAIGVAIGLTGET